MKATKTFAPSPQQPPLSSSKRDLGCCTSSTPQRCVASLASLHECHPASSRHNRVIRPKQVDHALSRHPQYLCLIGVHLHEELIGILERCLLLERTKRVIFAVVIFRSFLVVFMTLQESTFHRCGLRSLFVDLPLHNFVESGRHFASLAIISLG